MASLTRSGPTTTLRTALRQPNRAYAVPSFAPASASPFAVFDRQLKRAQRDRAARNVERSRLTDYVKDDVAQGMVDRLLVRLVSPLAERHEVVGQEQRLCCESDDTQQVCETILTRRFSQDITRRYPVVLDVGSGPGYLAKHLDPEITQKVVMVDSSSESCSGPSRCRRSPD